MGASGEKVEGYTQIIRERERVEWEREEGRLKEES
jgi:hypothetical protein